MTYIKEQTLQQRQVLLLVLIGILVISVLAVSISILVIYPPQREKGEYKGPNNILFIVVDDLSPTLGCYGDTEAITPNIDSLATKSIIFKFAYAQQAFSAPSRTSFLTSRRPDSLCVHEKEKYWRDLEKKNFVTIPQHFKNHGYETISVGKIFHQGIVSNNTDDYPYSWSKYPYHPQQYKDQPEGTFPDIESTNYVIEYLKTRSKSVNKTQPFFLGVGYYKPSEFPREFLDLYPISNMDLVPNHALPLHLNVSWNPWIDIKERDNVKALNAPFPFGPFPEDFQKLARQSYYASLSYIDDQLGRLLEALENTGFAEHTAIVLLGDHGWSLGEHQERSSYSHFEVSIKVPLIIHIPGFTDKERKPYKYIPVTDLISKNTTFLSEPSNVSVSGPKYVSEELVELVDLFPTLVNIANIPDLPVPPLCRLYSIKFCSEGLSFYPVIKHHVLENSTDFSWKTGVFSQYPRPSENIQYNSDQPKDKDIEIMGYSIRTGRFRYTEWISFNDTICKPDWEHVVANELYDHKHDPYETYSVSDVAFYSNIVKELSKMIRAGWRHSLPPDLFGDPEATLGFSKC